jgi:phosphatidate cytidylyltransferase
LSETWIHLAPQWRMALLVLALLVVATGVVAILRRTSRSADFSELADRVRSWWIMSAIFFAAIAVSSLVSIVFFAFLSYWAMKEFVTLLPTRPADHRALFLAFLAIPVQYYWVATGWYGMFIIFIPVYMFLFLPIRQFLARDLKGFTTSTAQIQWGLMAFVFCLSHMAFLLRLKDVPGSGVTGSTLLLFLVFVVEISDVLQFVWGKLLGRHLILPQVSPKKTWEGFVLGISTTALAALGLRFLTPFGALETVLVALLITVAGFCGGAVMSAVKRDFGVKDFGGLIPGHGGMLDRVDSLCYAAPVFLHYVRYFHHL